VPDLPAYFLTWTTYGSWLHGDPLGSVDNRNNRPGDPYITPSPVRALRSEARLAEAAFVLDASARVVVDVAIARHASRRGWTVHARNVRSNHVHVVVSAAPMPPELVVGQFKSWGSRALRATGALGNRRRVWTKRASTRWINDERSLAMAVDYVLNHQ